MKTYEQRTKDVLEKIDILQRKRKLSVVKAAVCAGILVALALVLFLPFGTNPPDVRQYRNSPYYDLIRKINVATYRRPSYTNNFEKLLAGTLRKFAPMAPGAAGEKGEPVTTMPVPGEMNTGNAYQEVTDNQVEGVTEGDLIKRTDKHIFYLSPDQLNVFSIAGQDSEKVGCYPINLNGAALFTYSAEQEMYLSADGTAVTLILPGFGDALTEGKKEAFVCILTLDVSDPESITEIGRVFLTGRYLSSRLVDGNLLLISQYQIGKSVSFDRPETYLPGIGTPGQMQYVAAEDIFAPEELSNTRYTVMTMLEQKSMAVKDSSAFLSYSEELYVSKENIFATRSFTETTGRGEVDGDIWGRQTMTQITCMGYDADGFTQKGGITVAGTVKNQYSMDEYEGVLRVVTSTNKQVNQYRVEGDSAWSMSLENTRNVNLYCISMADWSIVACVESFAPEGESAESVRFDADVAYVCTAEVITMTDPVYYFDLSDLSNITWKDTGTIDGYSNSLVDFGDYLLGIGYNGERELKIEIYAETETGVESVAAYERGCAFSEKYKSYLIDRENQLVGLGVTDFSDRSGKYILLQFDGYQLRELTVTELNGVNDNKRAVLIDGWLYLFNDSAEMKVEKLW